MGGVARRAWARNPNAMETVAAYNRLREGTDAITLPRETDGDKVTAWVADALTRHGGRS